jgi:Flp pilus assembly protein TadG
MKKPNSSSTAQSLIEIALLLPVALFLLLGFLDLGRAVYYYATLSNAVREATRYAIVHRDSLEQINPITTAQLSCAQQRTQQIASHDLLIWNKLDGYLFNIADTTAYTDLSVCTDITVNAKDQYEKVAVNATYCFSPITPGITLIIGTGSTDCPNGLAITAGSSMWVTPGAK